MLKEKYESVKDFVKEHKTQIVTGVVCIGAAALTGAVVGKALSSKTIETVVKETTIKDLPIKQEVIDVLKNRIDWNISETTDAHCRLDRVCEIALNSLGREKDRILFEIDELKNYIANLDHTKTINLFSRIPEKEKMIETLQTQLKQIEFDEGVIKEQIDFLLND